PPKEEDWNGHLKGYYISYRPVGSSEQHYHKTVEVHNPHQRQEIHLTNLRLSMSYSVAIQAFTGKGTGPMSREVLVKTLDDAAPLSPTKEEFIQASQRHASLSLRSWKSGGCELLDFTVRLRQGPAQAWSTVAEGLPANQSQLLLRNLTPGATYNVHVVARSTAGATEAQYEFTTPNGTARQYSAPFLALISFSFLL
ncbi:hypothetical protein V5799_015343, partial [Amblyomma americanum]